MTILFSRATDRGRKGGTFACNKLFTFTGSDAENCICQFSSDTTAVASLDGETRPIIGDTLTVRDGRLKSKCTALDGDGDCSNWSYLVNTNANPLSTSILAPEFPVNPTVVINTPERVGLCDEVKLDLSSSTGNTGSPWQSLSFNVTSANGTDSMVQPLQSWLNTNYRMVPGSTIPRYLLNTGNKYSITVTLCNVLGSCGVDTATFSVLSRVKPTVRIHGSPTRNIVRAQEVYLSAEGFVASCDFGLARSVAGTDTSEISKSSQNLVFTWTVTRVSDEIDVTANAQLSTDDGDDGNVVLKSPRVILMPSYSLQTGEEYLFTVTVYSAEHKSRSTAQVSVLVVPGALQAIISGSYSRAIQPLGQPLMIDAGESYDSDSDYFSSDISERKDSQKQDMLGNLTFTWSCEMVAPALATSCPSFVFTNDSSVSPYLVTVSALAAAAGSTARLTVTVKERTFMPLPTGMPTSMPTTYNSTWNYSANATQFPTSAPSSAPWVLSLFSLL